MIIGIGDLRIIQTEFLKVIMRKGGRFLQVASFVYSKK
jgi:hypothetical protein